MRPLIEPGFFRRLFNLLVPENGYIELETLLASRPWWEIHEGHVEQVLRRHGVRSMDRERAAELYAKAVTAFVADDSLTDAEATDLQRLRDLIGLNDAEAEAVQRRIVDPRYEKAVAEVLDDGQLTEGEQIRVAALRKALRVDDRTAIALWERNAEPILSRRWQEAVADRRLSPDELRALEALARNFGITVNIDSTTKAHLDRFHWYWLMEHGTFPDVQAPINLQRGEICHFAARATMHEMRTETQRVNYVGTSVRIRIMKGVYYRVGSTSVQRVTREVLRQIDDGTLYVTNKRIVFDGARKNASIRLANVLSVVPYADGIEIDKTSGRNPIFTVTDPEWLTVLLTSVLAHA